MSDPRYTDPRLSDAVLRRDETIGGPWRWVAGIAVIALMRVRGWSFAIRRPPSLLEHPAQVDGRLLVDVFAPRSLEYLCLGPQVHREFAVVLPFDRPEVLEQGQDFAPLDVPAHRVPEDLLDRPPVVSAQVRVH